GYLVWLAPRYPWVRSRLPARQAKLRAKAIDESTSGHARTPGIVADLTIGMMQILEFARDIHVISGDEYQALSERSWRALGEVAAAQAEMVRSADPCDLFLRLLAGALASGRAHLAGLDGEEPKVSEGDESDHRDDAVALGWKRAPGGGRHPQGRLIGWINGDD